MTQLSLDPLPLASQFLLAVTAREAPASAHRRGTNARADRHGRTGSSTVAPLSSHHPIPWSEPAVCVRGRAFDRGIVVEGSLAEVVDVIQKRWPLDVIALLNSLPNRMTAPLRYEGSEITKLLKIRCREWS